MANILAIDDSSATLERVRSSLELAGHVIKETSDGAAAMEAAGMQRFDLVIADTNLDQANELIAKIKALAGYQFVPILGMGLNLSTEQKEAGAASGVTGWVAKPVDGDELAATVKAVLG